MAAEKSSTSERSPFRLLFFEALALGGYLYVRSHPIAQPLWDLNFRYNALVFLAAYPILFVYRWKVASGCLGMILWPLSYVLSLALGISCYLWLACGFYYLGSPFYTSLTRHEIVLGILFTLVYFPLLQPILGIGKRYFSITKVFGILLFSVFGGFLGYLLGQFIIKKAGMPSGDNGLLFLLWLALILIGAAVGALGAQRKGSD